MSLQYLQYPESTETAVKSMTQLVVRDNCVEYFWNIVENWENDCRLAATSVHTMAEATLRHAVHNGVFDPFIFNIGLPDGNDRDHCDSLGKKVEIPYLILTGSNPEVDVVQGSTTGADDNAAKPFRMAVLLGKLRSQIVNLKNGRHRRISIGHYTFHLAEKMLHDPT